MGCRGYLVGNGFPRVLRHSPTTMIIKHQSIQTTIMFQYQIESSLLLETIRVLTILNISSSNHYIIITGRLE